MSENVDEEIRNSRLESIGLNDVITPTGKKNETKLS